ncbi:MAG: helix-hairpin-helix domain-containing protein [Candidatus Nanopelagicales bacterium]
MGSPRSRAHVRARLSRVSGSSGSTQQEEQEPSTPTVATGFDHVIAAPAAERAPRADAEETRATRGVLGASRTRRFFGAWDGRSRRAVLVLIGGLGAVLVWWWVSGQPSSVTTVETDDSTNAVNVVPTPESAAHDSDGGHARANEISPVVATSTVVVHVVGKVASPGVVELPAGSRVLDAVEAAGGVTSSRASSTVNLARLVVDGEQIDVGADPRASGGTSRISLNSADAEQLQQLPGVGPVIAERIVAWRTANGPFRSVAELGEVSGIGPAMIARIEDQVGM